jgi:hypothetical protein
MSWIGPAGSAWLGFCSDPFLLRSYGLPGSLAFVSGTTGAVERHCDCGALIPWSGLAAGRSSALSSVSLMASSAAKGRLARRATRSLRLLTRRILARKHRPRIFIFLAAMIIGVVAGLVGNATTSWAGLTVGLVLLAILVVLGTPFLFGPLASPGQIRRLKAELAEQARRESSS